MSETPENPAPAQPTIVAPRSGQGRRRRISLVWIAPFLAALVGIAIVTQNLASKGPLIHVSFERAPGVVAGRTTVRHRDVEVGVVEEVTLGDDLQKVIVTIRIKKDISDALTDGTQFWFVKPRVSASQITGIQTLLGGTYIEAEFGPQIGPSQRRFTGLEEPPLTPAGTPGMRIVLQSDQAGAVGPGSPIYYRGISVGQIERIRLSEDNQGVEWVGFVNAPYHRLITENSRFWNISGVELRLDAEGVRVNLESLESLIQGGVTFAQIGSRSDPLKADDQQYFTLHKNEQTAREAVVGEKITRRLRYRLNISDSVRGLTVGAPVEYLGVRLGEVVSVDAAYSEDRNIVEVSVAFEIQPERIANTEAFGGDLADAMDLAVSAGLRAQLEVSNLLTGALFVNLVNLPEAPPAVIDYSSEPYPRFPIVPSAYGALVGRIDEITRMLAEVPLNDLVVEATKAFESASVLLSDPNMKKAPEAFAEALDKMNEAMKSLSPGSELYFELSAALRELQQAADSFGTLVETIEDKPNSVIFGK